MEERRTSLYIQRQLPQKINSSSYGDFPRNNEAIVWQWIANIQEWRVIEEDQYSQFEFRLTPPFVLFGGNIEILQQTSAHKISLDRRRLVYKVLVPPLEG